MSKKKKKKTSQLEGQISFFDMDILPIERLTPEEMIENLRHRDVGWYRTKTIKSGNMLECEIFPIWKSQEAKRAKKEKPSREAQENLNHKNTQKKIMRLINANFTEADLFGTFNYDKKHLPETPEAAKKDVINFIRRIKNLRKKLGLPPFKYIYVTEWTQHGMNVRKHHHIVMSGDMDRTTLEKLWKGGGRSQTKHLELSEDKGLDDLGKYLSKGSRYEKMWGHSLNLKPPIESVADRKITMRQVTKIASDENAAPAIFEKACKGYTFREMQVKRSEWVAGAYVYVQMYKKTKNEFKRNNKNYPKNGRQNK